jgi:hypothetical protein
LEKITVFCGIILEGAHHTKGKEVAAPTYSGVFSRPEFGFWDWDCLSVRTTARLYPCDETQFHPCLHQVRVVFKSRKGVKTMTITTPKTGTQSPTSRKSAAKATPNPTYCPRCNEQGIFCTCTPQIGDITTKLEVKRIKRGTFLSTFGDVGGAK